MTETVLIRANGVAWEELDDELIILDEEHSMYLRLVGAATELWPMMVQGTTVDALSAYLCAEYGIATDRAEADVRSLIADLRAQHLLETSA